MGWERLIALEPEVARLGVHVAYTVLEGVTVSKEAEGLSEHGERLVEEARSRYTLESLREHPVVRAYRDFMWRLGIDPTKTRPSSEALVRRLLRRGRFPHINNVVDSGNFASVETLVPIGLYDMDRLTPPLTLRYARRGERFNPIGGEPEELEGGEVVLADAEGRILHIYPHRDSRETMIREDTRRVLVVSAGVPGVSKSLVVEAAKLTASYIERYASARTLFDPIYVG